MHPHYQLLETFYSAFQKGDAETMARCYGPSAHFSDPVFTDLSGSEPGDMWRMLCARSRDFRLTFEVLSADQTRGSARWVANYTFSKTGRAVENHVQSSFEFADGKIARQVDSFDFYKWTRMALGLPGVLLGWSPMLQGSVRKTARAGLNEFRAQKT
jgi:ketosteroid isomerase-like protein